MMCLMSIPKDVHNIRRHLSSKKLIFYCFIKLSNKKSMGKLVLFWSSTVICFSWDQNLTEVHWQMFFHELQHPFKPRFKGKHVTVRACHCFDQSKTGCRASVRVSTCHATTSTKLCFSSTFACSVAKNTFFARHLLHISFLKQKLYCLQLAIKAL